MTIAEKLTTVAENVEKVYEAGFKKGSESGGATADTREIYQGTRPLEWIRMPDYDKLGDNTFYVLLHIAPFSNNHLGFKWSFKGNVTIEYGSTKDGVFVADAEFGKEVIEGAGIGTWAPEYNKSFNYDDWGKYQLSNGKRQILIRLTFDQTGGGIRFSSQVNEVEVKDVLCNYNFASDYFNWDNGTTKCDYHYMTSAMTREIFSAWLPAKYIGREEGNFTTGSNNIGVQPAKAKNIVKFLNTWKAKHYGETFRECRSLEEVTIDISEITGWGNPFRGTCENLRRVIFIGGENLTSFPGDIDLNPSSLNVDGVREFFNTLPDITPSGTVRTITLTNSPAATAGIPEDVLSIATTKGWTVTT